MNVRKLPNYNEEIKPAAEGFFSGVKSALGVIKNKGQSLSNRVVSSAKTRPAVFLGVALATGFLLGKVLRRKL